MGENQGLNHGLDDEAAAEGSVTQPPLDPKAALAGLAPLWPTNRCSPDEYQTLYGHLSRVVTAKGRTVEPGEVIGLAGNSGRSSAPHLHFEVRHRGAAVDPLTLVKQEG
jgi:hypothetical protein